jgi:hypothetical protein
MKVLRAAFFYFHVTRKKAAEGLSYKKRLQKTLMKLTPSLFHQHFYVQIFFARTSFRQLFLVTFWLWQKIGTKNACEKR